MKNLLWATLVFGAMVGVAGPMGTPVLASEHHEAKAEAKHHAAFECPKCHAESEKAGECKKCHVAFVEAHDEHHDDHHEDHHDDHHEDHHDDHHDKGGKH